MTFFKTCYHWKDTFYVVYWRKNAYKKNENYIELIIWRLLWSAGIHLVCNGNDVACRIHDGNYL